MAETVAKNRRKLIDRIFENARNVRSYTLTNNFEGAEVPQDKAFGVLHDALYNHHGAKMTRVGTRYTIHIHSNHWLEFDFVCAE